MKAVLYYKFELQRENEIKENEQGRICETISKIVTQKLLEFQERRREGR